MHANDAVKSGDRPSLDTSLEDLVTYLRQIERSVIQVNNLLERTGEHHQQLATREGENLMNTDGEDFALVYRQALAEQDPDRKAKLLSRVTEIISDWHRRSEHQRLGSHDDSHNLLAKRPAVSAPLSIQPSSFKRPA